MEDKRAYNLNKSAAEKLARTVKDNQHRAKGTDLSRYRYDVPRDSGGYFGSRVAVATIDIPARTGAVCGSGTAILQKIASDGTMSNDKTVDVFNWSNSAVTGGDYFMVHMAGSKWVCGSEDCPA